MSTQIWNGRRRWVRRMGVLLALVGAVAALIIVTGASAANPSTVCAPVPNQNTTGDWAQFGSATWTASGLLTKSKAAPGQPYGITCGGAAVYNQGLPTTNPRDVNALSFDFDPSVSGPSGDSPRMMICFSDGSSCNSNITVAPAQWQAGSFSHFDAFASSGWNSTGGSCGTAFGQTYSQAIACHSGASIIEVAVINDSGSQYPAGESVVLQNMRINDVVAHATVPIFEKRALVAPLKGAVKVKRPGTKRFHRVKTVSALPYGTLVDALNGHLQVVAAKRHGGFQSGQFYGGTFRVTQGGTGYVQAKLNTTTGCPKIPHEITIARVRRPRLWGHVKGHYRTRGAYGSASVRGTVWLTENRCNGTFFHVVEGTLRIRDFTRHRTVILHAGHSYLAPAPPRHRDRDGDGDGD
jgi:hypothetical protein